MNVFSWGLPDLPEQDWSGWEGVPDLPEQEWSGWEGVPDLPEQDWSGWEGCLIWMGRIFGPAQKIRRSGKLPIFFKVQVRRMIEYTACNPLNFLWAPFSLKEPHNVLDYYKLG